MYNKPENPAPYLTARKLKAMCAWPILCSVSLDECSSEEISDDADADVVVSGTTGDSTTASSTTSNSGSGISDVSGRE